MKNPAGWAKTLHSPWPACFCMAGTLVSCRNHGPKPYILLDLPVYVWLVRFFPEGVYDLPEVFPVKS